MEAIEERKGIDATAQLCREKLNADPSSGYLVYLPHSPWHGDSSFTVRRPGELAGHQAFVQGTF